MLKLSLSAVYCYAYVDDTDGNACVVYVRYGIFFIQLWAFRI
jgi:hypothetical protein